MFSVGRSRPGNVAVPCPCTKRTGSSTVCFALGGNGPSIVRKRIVLSCSWSYTPEPGSGV
jgi:hypothetical protein